ncbi:MAG TPA: hypothetical protein VLA12_07235 [Planctomycetaceae bacterium]|nr:hypothetical protein [Planctomycetaceae bacterium]
MLRHICLWVVCVSIDLCVVANAEEPKLTRITADGEFKQRPCWSPDGKEVTFARHRGVTIYLYRKNLVSGEETRLTKHEWPEYDAVYSPDGKTLALGFDKASPNQGNIEVYLFELESETLTPLAVDAGKLSHEESPCWSPDSKQIAFSSTRDGNQELYTIDRNGQNLVRLTDDAAIDAHPAWSPDGKTIAFSTNRWGDLELALISPDGTNLRRLTNSPGLDDYPVWSPDGRILAFTSNRDRNLEIYVMSVSTGKTVNITQNRAIDNFPAWTPEGNIGFVSNRDGGFDIYVDEPPAEFRVKRESE